MKVKQVVTKPTTELKLDFKMTAPRSSKAKLIAINLKIERKQDCIKMVQMISKANKPVI